MSEAGAATVPLKRTWRHRRGVAHTQLRRFLVFLLIVSLGQGRKLCAVLLFDDRALPVESLDIVEPKNTVASPGADLLETILEADEQSSFSMGEKRMQGGKRKKDKPLARCQRSARRPPRPWRGRLREGNTKYRWCEHPRSRSTIRTGQRARRSRGEEENWKECRVRVKTAAYGAIRSRMAGDH